MRRYDERLLLQQVAASDEQAFRQLFNQYKARIYSAALRITRSEAAAEELLQDVFMIIWLRREKLTEIENFPSYLFIIVRNEAYRAIRKIAKERRSALHETYDESYDTDTEALISLKEYQDHLRKIVDQLPPQQKQAYRLIREKGLSREEAANAMQVSPQTVKAHLAKALKTIRAYLNAHFESILIIILLGRK
jgi:RNA polymerase sigma-70 factor (family 1)